MSDERRIGVECRCWFCDKPGPAAAVGTNGELFCSVECHTNWHRNAWRRGPTEHAYSTSPGPAGERIDFNERERMYDTGAMQRPEPEIGL